MERGHFVPFARSTAPNSIEESPNQPFRVGGSPPTPPCRSASTGSCHVSGSTNAVFAAHSADCRSPCCDKAITDSDSCRSIWMDRHCGDPGRLSRRGQAGWEGKNGRRERRRRPPAQLSRRLNKGDTVSPFLSSQVDESASGRPHATNTTTPTRPRSCPVHGRREAPRGRRCPRWGSEPADGSELQFKGGPGRSSLRQPGTDSDARRSLIPTHADEARNR